MKRDELNLSPAMNEPSDSPHEWQSYDRVNDSAWDVIELLWSSKWLIAAAISVGILLSTAYLLSAPKWYRAEVLISPVDGPDSGANLGLSGLATLAGVGIGGSKRAAEAQATLESEDFTRAFIEEQSLLPILFESRWDNAERRWKGDDPTTWPDSREGALLFDKKVRHVNLNRETGLITLVMEWTSPDLAANWANAFVARANLEMRRNAQAEGERSLKYLENQLEATSLLPLQDSITRLIESEHQKLMLAERTDEFSFRVIDRADPAKSPSKPNRLLILTIGALLGGIASILGVLSQHAWRQRRNMLRRREVARGSEPRNDVTNSHALPNF